VQTLQKLNKLKKQINTLRKIAGKTRLDHIRNRGIGEQCEIQPIGEWVNIRRDEWNNHISIMTGDRIVRVVRNNSPKLKGDQEDPVSDGPTLTLHKQADSLSERRKKKKKKKKKTLALLNAALFAAVHCFTPGYSSSIEFSS
jgi:hypothetical protein